MTEPKVLKTKRKLHGVALLGAGPGRPKGLANKMSTDLKAMILQALDKAGGVDYLLSCAHGEKTQAAFLSLIGKVLPLTIAGPGADGAHVFTVIERRIVKAND